MNMNKPSYVRPGLICLLAMTLICASLLPALAATPRPTPVAGPSPFADQLSEAWGSAQLAKRPAPPGCRTCSGSRASAGQRFGLSAGRLAGSLAELRRGAPGRCWKAVPLPLTSGRATER